VTGLDRLDTGKGMVGILEMCGDSRWSVAVWPVTADTFENTWMSNPILSESSFPSASISERAAWPESHHRHRQHPPIS